ncbi:efflux RND transporter periplasmic adaptor subunit [Chondromyces crocatus]|uniref:RND family efflux transporter MFP subunit n=1 Tax=Chondromyces crocatus TaxID=52 RepID=A0A0K1EU08_CHOCO|nr:efflux RND transporter periplasmic adaptor subunit [Chondromyces crocatus]AKT44127.1 RND family efflux transporter MFP subunit [Chondromyces crocatus]
MHRHGAQVAGPGLLTGRVRLLRRRDRGARLLLGAALCVAVAGAGCSSKAPPPPPPPAPVRVATAEKATVPVRLKAIGAVEPSSTVTLQPRVSAQITKVLFKEGQDVKAGDPLFQLDQRPFQVALAEALAQLKQNQVQLQNARTEAERYLRLQQEGVGSKEQAEQKRAAADALAATVQANQATAAARQLDLTFTTIKSPIDGRTGAILAHEGNLVTANTTNLVVINRLKPIYVTFTLPEHELAEVRHFMEESQLGITASPPEKPDAIERGTLSFVDNTVDRATGTVKVKGTFDNTEARLWPGLFVEVSMTLTTQKDAIVVPGSAIQAGQEGDHVFVVGADQTAELRNVKKGGRVEGDRVVISEGVSAGDQVITDGQLRLTPGAKIGIVDGPPPKDPAVDAGAGTGELTRGGL